MADAHFYRTRWEKAALKQRPNVCQGRPITQSSAVDQLLRALKTITPIYGTFYPAAIVTNDNPSKLMDHLERFRRQDPRFVASPNAFKLPESCPAYTLSAEDSAFSIFMDLKLQKILIVVINNNSKK